MIFTFNPTPAHSHWITLSGPDSEDFLHRLTTVNVKSLPTGSGHPGFFLTAQGKIRAIFDLWHFGPQDFAFEINPGKGGHWRTELLAAIDQYTFAERFTLTEAASLECRWFFAESAYASELLQTLGTPHLAAHHTTALDEEIRLCHHGERHYGHTWVSAWGRPARLAQWFERALGSSPTTPLKFEQLEAWRIQALQPELDHEITFDTIPLEVGLIHGLDEAKGCYPGQEVIERILSLGSPARRLALIHGQGTPPKPGDPIFNLAEPPIEVGQVTSVLVSIASPTQAENFTALGFVRKIHAKPDLEVQFTPSESRGRIDRLAPYGR
ncbi:hypothetical protein WDW37_04010 [Bdellovibrionota bacterium FG-1]